MSKGRNRRRKNSNGNTAVTVAGQVIRVPENMGAPIKELLFHPMIYRSGHTAGKTVDFENMHVPFLVKDNLVFQMMFMSGCGGPSVYVECIEMDPDMPSETYRDAMLLMRECLDVEKRTGTEYYFGHLDKGLEYYTYGLQLLIDRGFLEKEHAVTLIRELGLDTDDMFRASLSVSQDIGEAREREEQMRGEAGTRKTVNDIMTRFILSILGQDAGSAENERQETAGEETAG